MTTLDDPPLDAAREHPAAAQRADTCMDVAPGLGPCHARTAAANGSSAWARRLWSTRLWPRLPLAVVAGQLTDLAFAPGEMWGLAPIGMILLLLAAWGLTPRSAWLVGLAWGLAFFGPHLHFTLVSSGTPIAWIALSTVQAAIQALALPLLAYACRAPGLGSGSTRAALGRSVVAAALWVVVEQVRAVWPFSGLPWGILAYSQNESTLIGLAPLAGSVGVSFAVVLSAALCAEAFSAVVHSSRQWPHLLASVHPAPGEYDRPLTTAASLGIASVLVVTSPAALTPVPPPQAGALRAVVVQGNIPEAGASWADNAEGVVRSHAEATLAAVEHETARIDVVLWPESASDLDPRTHPDIARVVDGTARAVGAPILFGTQDFRPSLAAPTERSNDYITWVPGQGAVASYSKQVPVAFGEYMPMRDLLRHVTPAVDLVGTDMVAGTRPGLVEVPGAGRGGTDVPLAVGICFEVGYDRVIREGVLLGGQAIVVPTNNASFGTSRESAQQLAMARFRAVEHARAVVQVATTGISAVVRADGRVEWHTPMWEQAATVVNLPLATTLTPADRLGDLPLAVLALAGLGTVVAGLVTVVRSRARARERRPVADAAAAQSPPRKDRA